MSIYSTLKERIRQLETAIPILEDHLRKYGDQIHPKAYKFIAVNLESYRRELKIRKDFPIIKRR